MDPDIIKGLEEYETQGKNLYYQITNIMSQARALHKQRKITIGPFLKAFPRETRKCGKDITDNLSDDRQQEGQTAEDLKRDHKSLLRNPLIADVMYRRGLIEKWGRGTQRIVEVCLEKGYPEPVFKEHAGSVDVLFYMKVSTAGIVPLDAKAHVEEQVRPK